MSCGVIARQRYQKTVQSGAILTQARSNHLRNIDLYMILSTCSPTKLGGEQAATQNGIDEELTHAPPPCHVLSEPKLEAKGVDAVEVVLDEALVLAEA